MKDDPDLKAGDTGGKEEEKCLFAASIGLFTLPLLERLELDGVRLDDVFYIALQTAAPRAQVSLYIIHSVIM